MYMNTYMRNVHPLSFPLIFFVASGPMRFEYDHEGRRWLNARDGVTELRSLLTLELKATCGVNVDLE